MEELTTTEKNGFEPKETGFIASVKQHQYNATSENRMFNTKSERNNRVNPNCRKYPTKELYDMLEQVGGYNQKFMAHTPEEAGKRFPDQQHQSQPPLTIDDAIISSSTDSTDSPHPFVGGGPPVQPTVFGPVNAIPLATFSGSCGVQCQRIQYALTQALEQRDKSQVETSYSTDQFSSATLNSPTAEEDSVSGSIWTLADEAEADSGPVEVQEGNRHKNNTKYNRGCSLHKFIPIGNCTKRGAEEFWGFEKLCSACHGIFMLNSRCFPQFFNAVTCDKSDGQCIFDWWTTEGNLKTREKSSHSVHINNTKAT